MTYEKNHGINLRFGTNSLKLTPINKTLLSLRTLFRHNGWSLYAGAHKWLKRNDEIVLGGSSYMIKADRKMFLDQQSGDYGPVHLDLVQSCLKGWEIVTLDPSSFSTENSLKYLLAKTFNL